jgi:lipoprotein signal peptidase
MAVSNLKRIFVPQIVVCLMLLWAMNPRNPYGYYVVLRLVCCAAFAYLAVQAVDQEKKGWAWLLGVTAVVYNPIMPIHLTREIWSVVNIATIAVAIGSICILRRKVESRNERRIKPDEGDGR